MTSIYFQGGKYVLQIPATVWPILQQNKSFDGIRPTPNPKPNPDGTYTVKLTVFQWKKFQDNQRKAPVPAPKKPEDKKEPEQKKPTEAEPSDTKAKVGQPEKVEPTEEKPAAKKPTEDKPDKPEPVDKKPGEEITVTQEPSTY